MIRLQRDPTPTKLTEKFQADATKEFKESGKRVWNKTFIRTSLRNSSHGKCAFCECNLEEESKYLEVEHFAHKDEHPDLVVKWENLLPACRRCNARKSTHDVTVEPIINPYDEDPRDHLKFLAYRFHGLDTKGAATVDVIELNESDRLTLSRFKLGEEVLTQLSEVARDLTDFSPDTKNVRKRNRILSKLRNLLREAQPESEYSGTVATVIATSPDYSKAKNILISLDLWTDEFETLERPMLEIAYN